MERLVTLSDGTSMGGVLLVFKTNAPEKRLKELEKESCLVYINNKSSEDVPIWSDVLSKEGYLFDYVDEHSHITPFGTSEDWLEENYSGINEHYCIDDQPL
jgi:hypothetical protein